MSLREWYQHLLSESLTVREESGAPGNFIPCRVEVQQPLNDWSYAWKLARLPGLGSEHITFLWRLVHNILPTKERVNRLTPATPPLCKLCPTQCVETRRHAFFECAFNQEAGQALLRSLLLVDSQVTPDRVLRLELSLEDQYQHPTIWYLAAVLLSIWKCRLQGRSARLYTTRAEVESKVALLRETRYQSSADIISEMLKW